MKKLLIFSAGQGGKELLFITIEDINRVNKTWETLGFIDDKLFDSINKKSSRQKKITPEFLFGYSIFRSTYFNKSKDIYGVCDVMDLKLKKKIVEKEIIKAGFKLATLIHPSIIKPKNTKIGQGTIINPRVTVNYNVSIGNSVKLNYNSHIGHDVTIGDYTFIGPSSSINGRCTIGDSCIIGAGAILLEGVSIGENTIIGMGSVLTRDAKPNSTYFGNPAKKIL